MTINYDRSYLSPKDLELARRGYGYEAVRNFRFQFVYTEAERAENLNRPGPSDMGAAEWNKICAESARKRSAHMERVMEAIAEKHWCYQYNKDLDLKQFNSDDWDLFFWCNDFSSTMRGTLSGRDYSYFTLNFNDAQRSEKRQEVYDSVMDILERFMGDEHIEVSVQYQIVLDKKKIAADAEDAARKLVGKPCQYTAVSEIFNLSTGLMDGRIVEADGRYFFMKKRARSRGYLLGDKDILQIFLEHGECRLAKPALFFVIIMSKYPFHH